MLTINYRLFDYLSILNLCPLLITVTTDLFPSPLQCVLMLHLHFHYTPTGNYEPIRLQVILCPTGA